MIGREEINEEQINNATDKSELLRLQEAVSEKLINVKSQIDHAKAKIELLQYVDLQWLATAKAFKRKMGYFHQKILIKIKELNQKEKKNSKSLNDYFVDIARLVLTHDQFYLILNEAQQTMIKNMQP